MDSAYRATCRTQLTKLCNAVSDVLKAYEKRVAERSALEDIHSELVLYLQRIRNVHCNLKKADEAVRAAIKPEDMQKECDAVIEYDDKGVSAIARIEHILNTHFKADGPGRASGGVNNDSIDSSGVKLKAFELRKFDGNFENWLSFWEQFKCAVHDNRKLSTAAKFNYLSESLVGKAAATIAGFSPTEACYNEAIELLLEEYGDQEKIIEKYVQKLMCLTKVNSASDVKGLRHLYNDVSATMRSLSALKVSSSQYELIVRSSLLASIPAQLRIAYHKSSSAGPLSSTFIDRNEDEEFNCKGLKDLLDFIKVEVEALEKAEMSEKRVTKRNSQTNMGTAAGLLTSSGSSNNDSCVFCKRNNHATRNCKARLPVEEKKRILMKEARCFRCGNKNHNSKFCKAHWVKCDNCSGRHITSMCERTKDKPKPNGTSSEQRNERRPESRQQPGSDVTLSTREADKGVIFLQTAKGILSDACDNKRVLTRIIMDNGSQRTYVSEYLVSELQLKYCGTTKIKIIPFGEKEKEIKSEMFKRVKIMIRNQYDDKIITLVATVVPKICDDVLPLPKMDDREFNSVIDNWADIVNCGIRLIDGINLLIGQDYYWQFFKQGNEQIEENLFAVNTFFGWTLQGTNNRKSSSDFVLHIREAPECFDVTKFWDLESVGITNCEATREKEIICATVDKISFKHDRYQVSLPWQSNDVNLNDNKQISLGRLQSLIIKLNKNREKLIEYDAGIRELINNGIAERVPPSIVNDRLYYMPHRPVYREDKATTKMRIVFDASSCQPGLTSLNDHISVGENIVADLLALLISFRANKVVITADIEKAFLQISLAESDRDVHRFLWYESTPGRTTELPEIAEYRMTRVTFGVSSSPFLLSATIQKHLASCESQYGEVCSKLKKAFYVDDMVISEPTSTSAVSTMKAAREIMAKAKFNLRKWNSNDEEVRKHFDFEALERPITQKILGIKWCTLSDRIGVHLGDLIDEKMPRATKRNVLQTMARVYDPLGILGPFTVRIKILLQKIWKERYDWDTSLNGEFLGEFEVWYQELTTLKEYTIRRCLSPCAKGVEIHVFADASPLAYGAVAYSHQANDIGEIYTNFICSKNRVRPINKTTKGNELSLPKLELTACLMAARLKDFLQRSFNLKISKFFLWTDSTIALNWIHGNGKRLPYVKARVDEINQLTNIYEWRHCDGKSNPADLLTRGVKARQLLESGTWERGPNWLTEAESHWPNIHNTISSLNLAAAVVIDVPTTSEEPILKIEEFSRLRRLLRVTAYIFRFIKHCQNKISIHNEAPRVINTIDNVEELTYSEIQKAEKYWIKYSQKKYYGVEYVNLEKRKDISAQSNLACLNPVMINGMMRLQSRLSKPAISDYSNNPIILPKHCHLSSLLVREAHESVMHSGVNAVLAHLRKRFWIIQGRQLIKTIVNRCVMCKRLHGKSAAEPWTILPAERVATTRPFESTGVDFLGPLYVKENGENTERKVYVMLFTCAAIRAVSLELVKDMTAESCLNALRRFIARFGPPATIISDNAKTFKRADLELRKLEVLMKHKTVQEAATQNGITWKYIPERAAWWGGFWERLVRSVKNCLKAAIGKSVLTFDVLRTFLAEAESVINARPLTYITNDHNDLEPLTPAHFITNHKAIFIPADLESDQTTLAKSWFLRQSLIKRYFRRWQTEYLHQLRTIHHNKSGPSRSVTTGDVVLVHEDSKPRLLWKLAVVESVFQGRDGRVRSCNIRLKNNVILKRPIQLLYPLEISSFMAGPRM